MIKQLLERRIVNLYLSINLISSQHINLLTISENSHPAALKDIVGWIKRLLASTN